MNDHHIRPSADPRERLAHGILPALASADDHNRLLACTQIVRRIISQVARQGDYDLRYVIAVKKCIDAALENRAAAERDELLRLSAAEAQPASTRGDDCGNVSSQRRDFIKAQRQAGRPTITEGQPLR
jgi:hypothetical protein